MTSAALRRKKWNVIEHDEVCVSPPGLQYLDAHVMVNTFILILNAVLTGATGCC